MRKIQDEESDGEQQEDDGLDREVIAEQLFLGSDEVRIKINEIQICLVLFIALLHAIY